MKLRFFLFGSILALVSAVMAFAVFSSGGAPISSTPAEAADKTIHVGNTYFCTAGSSCAQGASNTVSINVGDTVTWTLDAGTHTTTSCTSAFAGCTGGEWGPADINSGMMSFQWTAGAEDNNKVFYYSCDIHGAAAMSGGIVVGTPPSSPTPSPTASPTLGPSPTPSPSATVSPTVTPETLFGNVDCSNDGAGVLDSLRELQHVANLPVSQNEPCPDIGSTVTINGVPRAWGYVDCSGGAGPVSALDALKGLLFTAGLPVAQNEPCPDIGSTVTLG